MPTYDFGNMDWSNLTAEELGEMYLWSQTQEAEEQIGWIANANFNINQSWLGGIVYDAEGNQYNAADTDINDWNWLYSDPWTDTQGNFYFEDSLTILEEYGPGSDEFLDSGGYAYTDFFNKLFQEYDMGHGWGWSTHGQYFPVDPSGLGSVGRVDFLYGLDKETLSRNMQVDRAQIESQQASRGLGITGDTRRNMKDLWTTYATTAATAQDQYESELANIYSSEGQNILDMLEDLIIATDVEV